MRAVRLANPKSITISDGTPKMRLLFRKNELCGTHFRDSLSLLQSATVWAWDWMVRARTAKRAPSRFSELTVRRWSCSTSSRPVRQAFARRLCRPFPGVCGLGGRASYTLGAAGPGGDVPRSFCVVPGAQPLLLVGNQESDSIRSFFIGEKGGLTPTGAVLEIPSPACLLYCEL